jgi:hypothetical protein
MTTLFPYTPPTMTIRIRKGVVGFAYLFPSWDVIHDFLRGVRYRGLTTSIWLHHDGGEYLVHSIQTVDGNTYAVRFYETPQYHAEAEMEYVAWAISDRYYTTI